MQIEKIEGSYRHVWSISYEGYEYCATHGPSMTDKGSWYSIDKLIGLDDKKVSALESNLPEEIGNLKTILKNILSEIEKGNLKGIKSNKLAHSTDQIPLILSKIKELEDNK